jgi:hypothetical protein
MEKSGTFLLVVGFFITAFGVGGVEQSVTDLVMIQCFAVAMVGCMVMGCGISMLKQSEMPYYKNKRGL